jgi:predicted nucleic acid-binding protein
LVAPTGKTEPVAVCLDADVLIAGLLSRTGASHAILILGEVGLLTLVLPEAVVDEVRRNLTDKLPETLPLFEEFLRSVPVRVYRPTAQEQERARALADPKDVPILAAAIGAGTPLLVTHNVRHFRSGEGVRVVRPRILIEEARAWMAAFGR